MSSRFSIVVPTLGRPTLDATLRSIATQAASGDQVVVVRDSHGDPEDRAGVRARCAAYGGLVTYLEHDAGRHVYGGVPQWNLGLSAATGDYLCGLGDDDIFTDGALDLLRGAVRPDRAVIGRVLLQRPWRALVPQQRVLVRHQVNGSGMVAPRWAVGPCPLHGRPDADFDWMQDVLARLGGHEPIWVDACVVIAQPDYRDGRPLTAGAAPCVACDRPAFREDLSDAGRCGFCETIARRRAERRAWHEGQAATVGASV